MYDECSCYNESLTDRQEANRQYVINHKGKKGKERKNWENKNSVWQGQKRFS